MASSEDVGGSYIKAFVFSMTMIIAMTLSSGSFLLGPINNPLSLVGAAAPSSAQANTTETVWLDAFDPYYYHYPTVYSQNPLTNGTAYKITLEGTWSIWPTATWNDANDPPVGPVEATPMYPGLGGEKTGPVGCDAFWGFACIRGEDYARELGAWPLPWQITVMISLDFNESFRYIRPIPDVYNPLHTYEVIVVGRGETVGFRIPDYDSSDNYGMLKFVIEPFLDADGDGLLDDWEKNGIDSNNDGSIDLVLPGADWQHKDIYVEVDYMELCRPDPRALSDVQAAFSKAPVDNPDGKAGINLHILVDQQMTRQLDTTWSDFDSLKSKYFGTAVDQLSPNKAVIMEARKLVSHYCIFAYQYAEHNSTTNVTEVTGNSGSGECPGNDFMVTLGYIANQNPVYLGRQEQAATFMHELGHNLGLKHGGNEGVNYKPNYLSIMNYMFQFNYLYPYRPLDYSSVELEPLNEAALNEIDGLGVNGVPAGSGEWLFTGHYDQARNKTVLSLLKPIDWDCDDHYNASVRANVNNCKDEGYSSRPDQILTGYNDWENIQLPFRGSRNFADGMHGELQEEITLDMMAQMKESAENYHEIALINATPSSTVIDNDDILEISVYSVNLGANNETTDLSIYAGTRLIAQTTITLERCNITSTILRCGISTVPKGDQIITICLAKVLGEADTIDNNYTYGAIEFTGESASSDAGLSWPLVLGISIAIIMVAVIVLFVLLGKRGKKEV